MKDKGFTLVELLAAIVILALLVFIGIYTVSNVFDSTKDNYYKSLENTLSIAGNEYFNDNRDDKPIDDYNFVDLKTLENHNYIDELKAYDGETKCDPKSGVYIYNTDNGTSYEVCLICGEYTPKEGSLCGGTKFGVINITGNINSPTGPYYNPLLSYSGTSWIDAGNIYITFTYKSEGESISVYKIYNSNTNTLYTTCNAKSDGTCQLRMDKTGSYFVEGYNESKKVANRKYFNIKLDNTSPSFAIKNTDTEFLLENDEILYTYENEIININDDNGYKEVTYTLTRYNPTKERNTEIIKENEDMMSKDLKIMEPLASGQYDLYIYVKDFAGNEGRCTNSSTHIRFYVRYYVGLQYFDNNDNKHDIENIKVYTYGKYDKLPDTVNINNSNKEVTWYKNTNFVPPTVSSNTMVDKTGYHILYGKEEKDKGTFRARCINPIYNGDYQQLATIPDNEKDLYRLLVYYEGQLQNNSGRSAGNYTVIALLNKGYTWNDGTMAAKAIQCQIKPYPIDVDTNPCRNDLVYNGENLYLVTTPNCDYLAKGGGTVGKLSCHGATVSNNTPIIESGATFYPLYGKDAGDYPVTYSLTSSNYVWSDGTRDDKTFTCRINPCSIDKPNTSICDTNAIFNDYNDVRMIVPISGTEENMNALYHYGDLSGDCDYMIGGIYRQEAGSYPVSIQLCNSNYKWSDNSIDNYTINCTMKPKSIEVTWDATSTHIYDAENWGRSATAQSGNDKDDITLNVTKATEVGNYNTTATCANSVGCNNYELTNNTSTFEITPALATVGSCNSNAKPDGSSLIVTGGTHVTYVNNTTNSAGEKTVTVNADKNYAFSDGTTSTTIKCTVKANDPTLIVTGPSSCNIYYCEASAQCDHIDYNVADSITDSYLDDKLTEKTTEPCDKFCKKFKCPDKNHWTKQCTTFSGGTWGYNVYVSSDGENYKWMGTNNRLSSRSLAISKCKESGGNWKYKKCEITCG